MKKIILTIVLAGCGIASQAQLMTVNDAKTKFEASVEYRGGTPIGKPGDAMRFNDKNRDFGNPEGTVYTHEALWHNFIFSPMTKLGVEAHHMSNDGVGNGNGNHYFRFGLNGMHVFMLPGYTRGISVTANLYAEASQFGVHRFDGVISTIFLYRMQQKNTQGVGFVWLCNNPQNMIGMPIYILKKDWGEHWSLNFMTWMGDFSYHFNKRFTLSASYGFGFERYWFKPEGHDLMMDNQTVLTPSASLQWTVSKRLNFTITGGGNLAFMNVIMNAAGTEIIDRRDARLSAFGMGKLSYNF